MILAEEAVMKTRLNCLTCLILSIVLLPHIYYAQETSLCEMIGKKTSAVISKYGKPQHHDKTSPYAECIFYQKKNTRLAFISDPTGVYQIQVDYSYNDEENARKSIDNFLNECGNKELIIDTLSNDDYRIIRTGVKMELTLFKNTYAGKYEVKFKAVKTE